jgi:hypothetical protein
VDLYIHCLIPLHTRTTLHFARLYTPRFTNMAMVRNCYLPKNLTYRESVHKLVVLQKKVTVIVLVIDLQDWNSAIDTRFYDLYWKPLLYRIFTLLDYV